MTSDDFRRRAIDEAIDRALRDMIQVDPRPGLRRRVLSRLESRSYGPGVFGSSGPKMLWSRGSWALLPAAAVLMIALALVFSRSGEAPLDVARTPAHSAPAAPLAPSAPAASPALSSPSSSTPAFAANVSEGGSTRARSEAIFGRRRDLVTATTVDRAVPPADVPLFDPVGGEVILPSVPQIVMSPLAPMTEIHVAPLQIRLLSIPPLAPARETRNERER